jgi:Peptidase family M28
MTTASRRALLLSALVVSTPAWAQIGDEENATLERLDVARTLETTRILSEDVVKNDSGAGAGSAISGSPDEQELAEAIASRMASIGLEVTRESFPVRAYRYGEVDLEVEGKRIPAITLHSSGGTWGSRDGLRYRKGNDKDGTTLRTELVDVGEGFDSDYQRVGNVEGKVVLARWTTWPGFLITQAAERGAAAILVYDYPGKSLPEARKQNTVIGHDLVPGLSISVEDARRLKESLSRGSVQVSVENRVDRAPGTSENVLGVLRGKELPDEWIVVSAHHDRWYHAAQDNAVGVAVVLELARVFSLAGPPRRSLLFVSFGSEETGGVDSPFDWLTGSYAFVKRHPEITERLAYSFNVDGAGWPAEKGYLHATLDQIPFQERLLRDLGLDSRVKVVEGVTDWVDAWNLGAVGGGASSYLLWFPAHGAYEGPESFSPYYHTQFDVFAPERFGNLAFDLKLAALGILWSERAEVVPVHLSEVGRWAAGELERDRERMPEGSLSPELHAAAGAAEELQQQASELESRFGNLHGETAQTMNLALMSIRKAVVPWLLSLSSEKAVLQTTPYVDDIVALSEALSAAERGDSAGAANALEDASTMGWGKLLSSSAYRRERLYDFGASDWSSEYHQNPRPVDPDVYELHRSFEGGSPAPESSRRLEEMRVETEGYLRQVLFVVTAKLEAAALAIRRINVTIGPTTR